MTRLKGWRFKALLTVPMVLVMAGVYLLVFDLIERVSTGANEADHGRATQVVQAALESSERQLTAVAVDNSYWEDAVNAVYDKPEGNWFFETWGVVTENATVYDGVFIVDRKQSKVLQGYKAGHEFLPQVDTYFDGCFADLLKQLPGDFSRHEGRAALMNTRDGLAIVAAAPVISPAGRIPAGFTEPRYFVLIRYATPDFMKSLSRDYLIQDLRLVENHSTADLLMRDREGHAVAAVSWRDSKPGDAALAAVKTKVASSLGSLTLVMIVIGLLCWHLFKSLAAREAAARREALTDLLTGLPNRNALSGELERLNAASKNGVIAVAFADLDGFKEVNDQYDHHVGDALIRHVAQVMTGLLGPNTFLARAGGDEFVAFFEGPGASGDAATFAERLIIALRQPISLSGVFASVGASVGVVVEDAGLHTPAELMRRADVAMYEAKARGRNRICNYSPAIDEDRQQDARVVAELRRFIAEKRIQPVFQPIVDAASQEIIAVEALARWPKDADFPCAPDKFISLAEKNGLIDELGEYLLSAACQQVAQWADVRLCFNISPAQLRNPGFVHRSLSAIERNGLAFQRVEFEVTEGILLDNIDRTRVQLQQLQAAGVRVALDDFGAGFSSIGYLKSISFDRIKIDRSIVSNFITGKRQQSIVQGTILMAAGMSAKVTAEGVESAEEAALLRLAGCEELQGYYFHKPMAAEALDRLLAPESYSAASRGRLSSAALSAASS